MSLSLLLAPAAIADTGGGNSAAAKMCQEGGYANYQRSDGTTFANEGACTSYSARGGMLVPIQVESVNISFTPTFDPNYCNVIVVLENFAPSTTYPAQLVVLDNGNSFNFTRSVMTDGTGSAATKVFSYFNQNTSVTATVDGLSSSSTPIAC
ncbi:MAG: hypothetical protein BGP03_04200 [Pseudonocardia sp. 73-21]|nr:MAG: hypothetical protein BGP03_04200 [Pseudonocardia sp. 73-21]